MIKFIALYTACAALCAAGVILIMMSIDRGMSPLWTFAGFVLSGAGMVGYAFVVHILTAYETHLDD